ncbi:hypothetical protein [Clostridium manihotivorum]|uniref:Uncharacterized protein n=1 Tax=Clostridium manihotivorum TaxID=2320868 RepID=A0A3R5X3B1_9CLOT|nr:hypothetical protein [Clostridium manihotivorum]QAA33410.1 hypothetical protein C1I91_18145 [Clostridium manihotivorum]
MHKLKNNVLIIVSGTVVLVFVCTVLLERGISLASKSDEGKIYNVSNKVISEKPITSNLSDNHGSGNLKKIELNDKQKNNQQEVNSNIESDKPTKEYLEGYSLGEPVDLNEQEALYQSVKSEINIKKEDAKNIFAKEIYKIFGVNLDIPEKKLSLMGINSGYEWSFYTESEKDKKAYWCILNALTGQCNKFVRVDYNGLSKAEYGAIQSKRAATLDENQLNHYIKLTKDLIIEKNILNANIDSFKNIYLENSIYVGLRPVVVMAVQLDIKRKVEVMFYTDTDELYSIDIFDSWH